MYLFLLKFICIVFGIKGEWKDYLQKKEELSSFKVELFFVLNDIGRLKRCDGEGFKG